MLNKSSKLL